VKDEVAREWCERLMTRVQTLEIEVKLLKESKVRIDRVLTEQSLWFPERHLDPGFRDQESNRRERYSSISVPKLAHCLDLLMERIGVKVVKIEEHLELEETG